MAETSIEWTDVTWNPVAGCSIMSAGCTNCYAMRMAARLEAMDIEKYRGLTRKSGGRAKWTGKVNLDYQSLKTPFRWKKPRRVFVNSMSDLFHPKVPTGFVREAWNVMVAARQHTFQILTKRPDRLLEICINEQLQVMPNIWLGTSVENADNLSRLEDLRNTPAGIRFVSFEPLIGSVSVANLKGIDWAIVGGESGPRARTLNPEWVDEVFAICAASGTAFFFKQWGGPNKKATGRLYRDRTWDDLPELRI